MNKAGCRTRLQDLMQAHIGYIADANQYLLNIKNAIAENDLGAIQLSLKTPDSSIAAMEQLEKDRRQLLSEFGFDGDNAGFEQCVRWCDDDSGRLGNLFAELVSELERLQHSIQVNNLLVNKGKDRVRRSIGILTGLGNSTTNTYGSNGEKLESEGRRNIAIA